MPVGNIIEFRFEVKIFYITIFSGHLYSIIIEVIELDELHKSLLHLGAKYLLCAVLLFQRLNTFPIIYTQRSFDSLVTPDNFSYIFTEWFVGYFEHP